MHCVSKGGTGLEKSPRATRKPTHARTSVPEIKTNRCVVRRSQSATHGASSDADFFFKNAHCVLHTYFMLESLLKRRSDRGHDQDATVLRLRTLVLLVLGALRPTPSTVVSTAKNLKQKPQNPSPFFPLLLSSSFLLTLSLLLRFRSFLFHFVFLHPGVHLNI